MNINEKTTWIMNQVEEAGAEGVAIAIDGTLQSAVCAALAKRAFPNNIFSFFVNINADRETNRNFLRITEALGLSIVRVDLTESYEKFIKDTFEIKNPYASLETYEHYHKTGEAPVDTTYLESDKLDYIRNELKDTFIEMATGAQATKRNYLVMNYDEVNDKEEQEDMVKLALELGIPENVIELVKGEWDE